MPQWLQIALAVLAAVLSVVGPLVAVIWHQLNEKIREHKEACDEDVEKLWDQIGRDSDSGMRKRVHQSAPIASHFELEKRVYLLERKDER